MNKIKLIKDALVAELERYLKEVVKVVKDYSYQRLDDRFQESWALMGPQGKCVTSAGIAHLLYLIKTLKEDPQSPGLPLDPFECLMVLRAVALHGDRSTPEYIDTITLLTDQCSMGIDRMFNGH